MAIPLKKLRVKAGLTQEDMATMLGMPRPAYTKRELGQVSITTVEGVKIVGILAAHGVPNVALNDLVPEEVLNEVFLRKGLVE